MQNRYEVWSQHVVAAAPTCSQHGLQLSERPPSHHIFLQKVLVHREIPSKLPLGECTSVVDGDAHAVAISVSRRCASMHAA